jgi:hypothetical protein
MKIPCPRCHRDYDSEVFAFGQTILCECGVPIGRDGWPDVDASLLGEDLAEAIKRGADRIVSLILYSDLPEVDIDIEIDNLRRWCLDLFPERAHLFEWVYLARFRRLREQFPREKVG